MCIGAALAALMIMPPVRLSSIQRLRPLIAGDIVE
jgi:hypothetical protein